MFFLKRLRQWKIFLCGGSKINPITWAEVVADLTARYTLYSTISPVLVEGGSQDKCAPSADLLILIAEGAPGKPGKHVLKAEI